MRSRKTFCRVCSAYCGIEVDIDDKEQIVAIRGDRDHPMSQGYTCSKGRLWGHQYHDPQRLLYSQQRTRRAQDFSTIDTEQALDEIAAKLQAIIHQHGPRAVAIYRGNGLSVSSNGDQVAHAWITGLGSEMDFSSMTLDQPSKIIAVGRHGVWGGGAHGFAGADVCMLIGNNPLVSALNMTGAPPGWYPGALKQERARGMRLIVIDPRRTETARQADIHLAIKPGEDPTLLAGMINLIIAEQRYDAEFVEQHTEGFAQLRQAVEAFTLDYVANRTGLAQSDIADAARLFANSKRGTASSGTGPDMAAMPHLAEHLILALNTLCGRWNREGDAVSAPSLLTPDVAPPAQTLPVEFLPLRLNPAADTHTSRIRGIQQVFQEMPTPVAAEEILTPGAGQVRALLVIGGNPALSWPDQQKTLAALQHLDLLVCIDIKHTATTRYADYLLPAAHALERDGLAEFTDRLYDKPFGQYSTAVVPKRGDVREEWRYFAGLAKRMGTDIELPGGKLDVHNSQLDSLDVFDLLYPPGSSKVSVRDIAQYEGGHLFEQFAQIKVSAPYPGIDNKLQLLPPEAAADLNSVLAQTLPIAGQHGVDGSYSHLFIVRRLKHVYNSSCHNFPGNPPGNPAWVHPGDLASLGYGDGDRAQLVSEHGAVDVILHADDSLRPGVVSMSHCFGPDSPINGTGVSAGSIAEKGSPAARLIGVDRHYDPLMGMPVMSGFAVRISPVDSTQPAR